MMLKRLWLLLVILVVGLALPSLAVVRYQQAHAKYSCLVFDGVLIQLDTSLFTFEKNNPFPFGFPSPDDRYRFNMTYHDPSASWSQNALFIEGIAGKKIVFATEHYLSLNEARWSPDSQYVAYSWINSDLSQTVIPAYWMGVADHNGKVLLERHLNALAPELGSYPLITWSPDGEYMLSVPLIFQQSVLIFQPRTGYIWELGRSNSSGFYFDWTSDGRLAYLDGNRVGVYDLNTGKHLFFEPLSGKPHFLTYYDAFVEWSPDEQHLAVSYQASPRMTYLLEVKDDAITPITQVKTSDVPSGYQPRLEGWSADSQRYGYIYTGATYDYGALRVYDLKTGDDHQLTPPGYFRYNGKRLAMYWQEGEHWQTEMMDITGENRTKLLPPLSTSQLDFYWSADNQSLFINYWENNEAQYFYLFGQDGSLLYQVPDEQRLLSYPLSSYDTHFVSLLFSQDEQQWLELVEVNTGQAYRVPSEILKGYHLQPNALLSFAITPAPDGHSWAVWFADATYTYQGVYRFIPSTGQWRTIYEGNAGLNYWVAWSPDSQTMAYVVYQLPNYVPNLQVARVDGSHYWNLGEFGDDRYFDQLTWTRCTLLGHQDV